MAEPVHGPLSGNVYIDALLQDGWKWQTSGQSSPILFLQFDDSGARAWGNFEVSAYLDAALSWEAVANIRIGPFDELSISIFDPGHPDEPDLREYLRNAGYFHPEPGTITNADHDYPQDSSDDHMTAVGNYNIDVSYWG